MNPASTQHAALRILLEDVDPLLRRAEAQVQRAHVYEASVPKEQTQQQIIGDLVGRAFNGSASDLVMQALSAKRATPAELAKIRELLDEYERGTK